MILLLYIFLTTSVKLCPRQIITISYSDTYAETILEYLNCANIQSTKFQEKKYFSKNLKSVANIYKQKLNIQRIYSGF